MGTIELQVFVSLVVVLGAAFVALICDFLKGNNEQLRESNIELRVRQDEREKREALVEKVQRQTIEVVTQVQRAAGVKPAAVPAKAVEEKKPMVVSEAPVRDARSIFEEAEQVRRGRSRRERRNRPDAGAAAVSPSPAAWAEEVYLKRFPNGAAEPAAPVAESIRDLGSVARWNEPQRVEQPDVHEDIRAVLKRTRELAAKQQEEHIAAPAPQAAEEVPQPAAVMAPEPDQLAEEPLPPLVERLLPLAYPTAASLPRVMLRQAIEQIEGSWTLTLPKVQWGVEGQAEFEALAVPEAVEPEEEEPAAAEQTLAIGLAPVDAERVAPKMQVEALVGGESPAMPVSGHSLAAPELQEAGGTSMALGEALAAPPSFGNQNPDQLARFVPAEAPRLALQPEEMALWVPEEPVVQAEWPAAEVAPEVAEVEEMAAPGAEAASVVEMAPEVSEVEEVAAPVAEAASVVEMAPEIAEVEEMAAPVAEAASVVEPEIAAEPDLAAEADVEEEPVRVVRIRVLQEEEVWAEEAAVEVAAGAVEPVIAEVEIAEPVVAEAEIAEPVVAEAEIAEPVAAELEPAAEQVEPETLAVAEAGLESVVAEVPEFAPALVEAEDEGVEAVAETETMDEPAVAEPEVPVAALEAELTEPWWATLLTAEPPQAEAVEAEGAETAPAAEAEPEVSIWLEAKPEEHSEETPDSLWIEPVANAPVLDSNHWSNLTPADLEQEAEAAQAQEAPLAVQQPEEPVTVFEPLALLEAVKSEAAEAEALEIESPEAEALEIESLEAEALESESPVRSNVVAMPGSGMKAAEPQQPAVASELVVPGGYHEPQALARLMEEHTPYRGLAMVVSLVDYVRLLADQGKPAMEQWMGSISRLVVSMTREQDFACRIAEDEFVLLFVKETGAAAKRRIQLVSERLWDFQLRSLGSVSLIFSWGAAESVDQSLAQAVERAREQMLETRQKRRYSASNPGRFRRVAND